jgi:hypothetical protein
MADASCALAVRVGWGAVRVASQVLVEGGTRRFSVGPGDDDVTARGGRVGFFLDAQGPHLVFTEGLVGELIRNGETPLTLSQVVQAGLAEETAAGWVVSLGRLDAAKLELGSLTVEALPVRAPPRVPFGHGELDFRFLNTLLAVVAVAGFFALRASFGNQDELDEGEPTSSQRAVFRRVLAATPPPAPRCRVAELPKTRERAKERRAEAGRPKASPSPASEGRRPKPFDVRQALGQALGPGAGKVLAGGGLGEELSKAMGSVVGASDGMGGWAIRGTGTGGDVGGPVGIGRIGVKHGTGPHDVPLGDKTHEGPEISNPVVTICDGSSCLDKEMVRAVIRSHIQQVRYCYEEELRTNPNLAGKVAVRFHVTAAGPVDHAELAQTDVPGTRLPDCLVSRVRTWVFPRTPGGFTVSYPFHFAPAGK